MTYSGLFVGGQDGYHTYRIPSIVRTIRGTLLAFCEGRMLSTADKSPTDLVLKRSLDNGETWTPLQVVVKGVPDAVMDPCPVVDQETGTIHLLYDRYPQGFKMTDAGLGLNSATAWVTDSKDDGQAWSEPRDITRTTKKPTWTQLAHGPGHGIQTRSGRLIIPCNAYNLQGEQWVSATYSDDHGESWQRGQETGPLMNESQVVELVDGTLMLNMRSYRGRGCRAVALSRDGGETWSAPADVPELIEPVCQASIHRYDGGVEGGTGPLLFSNPASHDRTRMTIKMSRDEGQTWPVAKLIYGGPAAYSCLVVLRNGVIGCLYECGERSPYEKIALARFSLEWLAG